MRKTLAVLALLATLPATAAFAGEVCDVPPQKRQSFEALGKLAGDFGWTIDKMKIDDGCYELRVTDASGNVLKVKIDPATLEVVDGSVKRFGDDSAIDRSPETESD
ncbi:PepSY domain-containing protein [Brucella tritici]|uniref:PepSY domain-containing protein n=1 Tax=Brucella tritici TaxID=94626 RepID=A0A6N6QC92_9HYPH|nr:PepSY domain-containing protein [Brucella tritici]KAB2663219.1 PepSY domain-containing protein [Brucella tritici]KAB2669778.1 PepSY domain-containing protein [Brucella tritici]KAB2677212.1 PepSY domain-containing protein [Brucella tritici]MBJ6722893.1 PepSY domain-containing protein [Bacillus sp. PR5]